MGAAREGLDVTIIEITGSIANNGNILYKSAIDEEFAGLDNLKVMYNASSREITDEGVITEYNDKEILVPADYVVYSVGMTARSQEAMAYYDICYDVRIIGDCVRPRRINEAAHEGYFAGHYM